MYTSNNSNSYAPQPRSLAPALLGAPGAQARSSTSPAFLALGSSPIFGMWAPSGGLRSICNFLRNHQGLLENNVFVLGQRGLQVWAHDFDVVSSI